MSENTINDLVNIVNSNLRIAQSLFEELHSYKRIILKDLNSIISKIEFDEQSIVVYGLKMCFYKNLEVKSYS